MWKLWRLVVLCICVSLALAGQVAAQTYVQSKTNALGSGGNNAATFTNAPTSGNTVVVGLVCYGPSNCIVNSITDNFGNTYSQIGPTASYGGPTQNITNATMYCASGISAGSNFTVSASLTNTSGDSNLYVAEYSGASCNVDQSASGSLTDGTATTLLQTASTPTTTNAADLLVAVGGAFAGGTATAGTGFSLRQNGSGVAEYGGYEDRVVTAIGAYSGSMNLTSTTTYWAMVMVALKSSSGTGPTITSFTPTSGPIGTTVTITGTNFTGATAVKFASTPAASFTVNSSTQITATVPTGASSGTISVTTAAGTANSSASFTVSGSGPITYIQSQAAALGTSGNNNATFSATPTAGDTIVAGIVCYGPSDCSVSSVTDNFGNSYAQVGPTALYGVPPTNVTRVLLYCSSSINTGANFKVTAALSNGSGGDSNLYVAEYSGLSCAVDQSSTGSATDGTATTVLQTSSASTTNASDLLVALAGSAYGGAATAGTNFVLRQNGNSGAAEFGGFEDRVVSATGAYAGNMNLATSTTYWAMTMVALKGSASGGSGPTVTSFSPTSGSIGTTVIITGTNFNGATAVKFFNNVPASSFTVNSTTQITASVPSSATSGPISVTTPAGAGTSSTSFTVTPTANFTFTGSMSTGRALHTATLLPNGKVLIAGGANPIGTALKTAEIYDPVTGTFTLTGNMNSTRAGHTATLLNNGTVLIAGGTSNSTAEIYDPATGNFALTGSTNIAHGSSTATLLNNGMVLIAGGNLSGTAAELYNPATGTFALTGAMTDDRNSPLATKLNNGMVLIVGGNHEGLAWLVTAEVYNPATGTFAATPDMHGGHQNGTLTLLDNGMVLVAGGNGVGIGAELYNPATNTFTTTGSLTTWREDDAAVLLTNGTVLVSGTDENTYSASTEIYNVTTATFTASSNMNSVRAKHTATLLNDGRVLVVGGNNGTSILSTAELYQPGSLTPAGLASILVTPANPTLALGASQQFVATGTFADASTQQLSAVVWTSSSPSVATITNDVTNRGTAKASALGATTISACVGSVCGSTTVTVTSGGTAPVISRLSPSSGPSGSSVSIVGSNFGATIPSNTVTFATGKTGTVTSASSTILIATVPTGAINGPVVVTVGGTASNGVSFTVTSTPSEPNITNVSPTSGTGGNPGTQVTITGNGFGSSQGNGLVWVGSKPGNVVSWTDTQIVATVAPGALSGFVRVLQNNLLSNSVPFAAGACF